MSNDNAFPFGAAGVSGNTISVDDAMNNPSKITRTIASLIAKNFWADKLLSNGGSVEGGALIFERPNPLATDLYPTRGFGVIEDGDEAPIVDFTRGTPMVARPVDIGGRFPMTRKAIKRNDTAQLARNMQRLANQARLTIENMALLEIDAVIASETRYISAVTEWDTLAALTLDNRTGDASPLLDVLEVLVTAETEERGHVYDSVLMAWTDWQLLVGYFGINGADGAAMLKAVFAQAGINNIYTSIRRTEGSLLFFAQGGVGEMRWEFPMSELTWNDEETKGVHQKWYQLDGSPLFAVADPYGMLELRGIRT